MRRPFAALLVVAVSLCVGRAGNASDEPPGGAQTQQAQWDSAARDAFELVRAVTANAFASGAPARCRLAFPRQGMTGTLEAANESRIEVQARGIRLTFAWDALSPKHVYSLGKTYLPADDAGSHLALSIYCYVNGLKRECEDEAGTAVAIAGRGGAFLAEASEVLDHLALLRAAAVKRMMRTPKPTRTSQRPQERRVPKGIDPSWRPMVCTDANVRGATVSFEIGFTSFRDMYKSDEERVRQDLLAFVEWANVTWVPEVMVHWTLKDIVIRRSPSEEPSHGQRSTNHHYKTLGKIDPELESSMLVKLTTETGGWSLGGWYSTGIRRTVVAHKYLKQHFHHEAAHAFQQGHGCGRPYEKGSMNGSNNGPYKFIPRQHVFNFKELEGMIPSPEKFGTFERLGPWKTPVPPYARMDFAHRAKDADHEEKIPLDVLANDHTANNGRLWIKSASRPKNGGTVGRAIGRGPGGRDVLFYKRPANPDLEYDFFTYTLVNDYGLESTGNVLVLFGGDSPAEVVHP